MIPEPHQRDRRGCVQLVRGGHDRGVRHLGLEQVSLEQLSWYLIGEFRPACEPIARRDAVLLCHTVSPALVRIGNSHQFELRRQVESIVGVGVPSGAGSD